MPRTRTDATPPRRVARERARLTRLFQRIVLLTAAPPFMACSATNEATVVDVRDASVAADADAEPSAEPVKDSGLSGACAPRRVVPDVTDEGGAACSAFYEFPCGLPEASTSRGANCQFHAGDCIDVLCAAEPVLFACEGYGAWCADAGEAGDASPADAGPVVVECVVCTSGGGRRPAGLAPARAACATSSNGHVRVVGVYFALAASLEAASVGAFRTLGRDLRTYGAPQPLVRETKRAATDEIRHARVTARIARAHGGVPRKREAPRATLRSLEAIAVENVAEGCVRETFGALCASWQARHADDRCIARVMRAIADDETRHAALAWAIHRWARAKLGASARARIDAAFDDAVAALRAELAREAHPELQARAGVPALCVQRRMLEAIGRSQGARPRRRSATRVDGSR